jgi:hypothetical protein
MSDGLGPATEGNGNGHAEIERWKRSYEDRQSRTERLIMEFQAEMRGAIRSIEARFDKLEAILDADREKGEEP